MSNHLNSYHPEIITVFTCYEIIIIIFHFIAYTSYLEICFCHLMLCDMGIFPCQKIQSYIILMGFFPWWFNGKKKKPLANARDMGLIPGLGRSPGEGSGNPLQDSCLGNPMDRRSLVGYSPWGLKRVEHNSGTKQQHYFNSFLVFFVCVCEFVCMCVCF